MDCEEEEENSSYDIVHSGKVGNKAISREQLEHIIGGSLSNVEFKLNSKSKKEEKVDLVQADDFFSSLQLQSSAQAAARPGPITRLKSEIIKHQAVILKSEKKKKSLNLNEIRKGPPRKSKTVASSVWNNIVPSGGKQEKVKKTKNVLGSKNDSVLVKELTKPNLPKVKQIENSNKNLESPENFEILQNKTSLSVSPLLFKDDEDLLLGIHENVVDDYDYNVDDMDEFSHVTASSGKQHAWEVLLNDGHVMEWETSLHKQNKNTRSKSDHEDNVIQQHPPATHSSGKWVPDHSRSSFNPPPVHTSGKWVPPSLHQPHTKNNSIVASCQSSLGKCLKTSGGSIQYFCKPCNRRLASREMYERHLVSELHFKRSNYDNDFEQLSSSQPGNVTNNRRITRKRIVRVPIKLQDNVNRKLNFNEKLSFCEVCKTNFPKVQLGRHLVSYFHRCKFNAKDPTHVKFILENIQLVVNKSYFQCHICNFYCNINKVFKQHFTTERHKQFIKTDDDFRFYCMLCSIQCKTNEDLIVHLDSAEHINCIKCSELTLPIIIKQMRNIECQVCKPAITFTSMFKKKLHDKKVHKDVVVNKNNHCAECNFYGKTSRSLQCHIFRKHKNKKTYYCSFCDLTFESGEEAKKHRKSSLHSLKWKLINGLDNTKICSYCKETFEDLDLLKKHLMSEHENSLPKCNKCGAKFAIPQELTGHLKMKNCVIPTSTTNATIDKSFKCKQCKYSSENESDLLVHQIFHHEENKSSNKRYPCPHCDLSFSKLTLKRHLRCHTNDLPYDCKYCSLKFQRVDTLSHHLSKIHSVIFKKNFKCKSCNVNFNDIKVYRKHLKKHLMTIQDYNCEMCRAKFNNKEKLDLHYKQSHPNKGRQCQYCSFVETSDCPLGEHISRSHVVFGCRDCNFTTINKSSWISHRKAHLGVKAHACPYCKFSTYNTQHIERHIRIHTGVRPFKCPYCPYRCSSHESIRKHVLKKRIHHGKPLYTCKQCQKFSTNSASCFKDHLIKYHRHEVPNIRAASSVLAGLFISEDDNTITRNLLPKKIPKPKLKDNTPPVPVISSPRKVVPILPKCDIIENKDNEEEISHQSETITPVIDPVSISTNETAENESEVSILDEEKNPSSSLSTDEILKIPAVNINVNNNSKEKMVSSICESIQETIQKVGASGRIPPTVNIKVIINCQNELEKEKKVKKVKKEVKNEVITIDDPQVIDISEDVKSEDESSCERLDNRANQDFGVMTSSRNVPIQSDLPIKNRQSDVTVEDIQMMSRPFDQPNLPIGHQQYDVDIQNVRNHGPIQNDEALQTRIMNYLNNEGLVSPSPQYCPQHNVTGPNSLNHLECNVRGQNPGMSLLDDVVTMRNLSVDHQHNSVNLCHSLTNHQQNDIRTQNLPMDDHQHNSGNIRHSLMNNQQNDVMTQNSLMGDHQHNSVNIRHSLMNNQQNDVMTQNSLMDDHQHNSGNIRHSLMNNQQNDVMTRNSLMDNHRHNSVNICHSLMNNQQNDVTSQNFLMNDHHDPVNVRHSLMNHRPNDVTSQSLLMNDVDDPVNMRHSLMNHEHDDITTRNSLMNYQHRGENIRNRPTSSVPRHRGGVSVRKFSTSHDLDDFSTENSNMNRQHKDQTIKNLLMNHQHKDGRIRNRPTSTVPRRGGISVRKFSTSHDLDDFSTENSNMNCQHEDQTITNLRMTGDQHDTVNVRRSLMKPQHRDVTRQNSLINHQHRDVTTQNSLINHQHRDVTTQNSLINHQHKRKKIGNTSADHRELGGITVRNFSIYPQHNDVAIRNSSVNRQNEDLSPIILPKNNQQRNLPMICQASSQMQHRQNVSELNVQNDVQTNRIIRLEEKCKIKHENEGGSSTGSTPSYQFWTFGSDGKLIKLEPIVLTPCMNEDC